MQQTATLIDKLTTQISLHELLSQEALVMPDYCLISKLPTIYLGST